MDIKLVIKALQLGDEEWEEHLDLINRLRLLTDTEQSQLFSALEPQKKSSKKSAGEGGGRKSKHASSIQEQVQKHRVGDLRPSASESPSIGSEDDDPRCQAKRSDGRVCMLLPDHNIHHLPTAMDYHEFQPQPAEQAAATSGD